MPYTLLRSMDGSMSEPFCRPRAAYISSFTIGFGVVYWTQQLEGQGGSVK